MKTVFIVLINFNNASVTKDCLKSLEKVLHKDFIAKVVVVDNSTKEKISIDEKEFGKTIGGDLVEGKKTFLFLEALEKSRGEDRKKLLKVVEQKGIRRNQVSSYKMIYEKLGVLDDARREIRSYTQKALRSVNLLDEENKKIFKWLADSLIHRTS